MPPWRPDSPVELSDGSLVCKRHGLVICGICICDYSFMEEILAERDSAPSASSSLPKKGEALKVPNVSSNLPGTKQPISDASIIFPIKFQPPNSSSTPKSCFARTTNTDIFGTSYKLFLGKYDPECILISTDGSWVGNGGPAAKAGCAFVWYPGGATDRLFDGRHYFRLENCGPNGDPQPQTSNRAELRAVIGALQFRIWGGPGYDRLVIATDSEYVVNGITLWIKNWLRNGWVTSDKKPVENRDLWEMLLKEVRRHATIGPGLQVMFWAIPRNLNKEADEASRKGAEAPMVPEFVKYKGVMIKPTEMAVIKMPLEIDAMFNPWP